MSTLDHLVNKHVTPRMDEGGFEKVGRVFRAVSPSGDHAFIWYSQGRSRRPGVVTFTVTASIITTIYWAFTHRNEPDPGPPRPDGLFNTLVVDVEAPSQVALHPVAEQPHLRRSWAFDAERRDACGQVLASYLAGDLGPWLLHRLDRDALVEEFERPTKTWRGAPHGTATRAVLALLDDGPLTEIERRLPQIEDVTPDKSLTAWITGRLDARRLRPSTRATPLPDSNIPPKSWPIQLKP